MTTLELQEYAGERRNLGRMLDGLRAVVAAVQYWHAKRQTLARLSQLDDRLLTDVGIDPAELYDAVHGEHTSLWEKPHLRPDIR
jgi:uncharacterized protein YjiS (DUF1127 family)